MDYNELLDLAADLGYGLLESGAEIYRVEESIQRLLHAYGITEADPFVIPNCIIVSFITPEGKSMTQVRRMPSHGTDIDLLERYNDLCRRLCREAPPLNEAQAALKAIPEDHPTYSFPAILLAYFFGCAAFSLFFGGSWKDGLCGGLCGMAVGAAVAGMTRLRANLFFKSMLGATVSAFLALLFTRIGLGDHSDLIIIGAIMGLVPGIIFTNAIRDVMAGDMVAGIIKLTDAVLTGVSVALGTGFAIVLTGLLWGV